MSAQHVDPATIPYSPISPAPTPQSVVSLAFLLNGMMRTNRRFFVDLPADEAIDCPAWGYLITKTHPDGRTERIVVDPGCRKVRDVHVSQSRFLEEKV